MNNSKPYHLSSRLANPSVKWDLNLDDEFRRYSTVNEGYISGVFKEVHMPGRGGPTMTSLPKWSTIELKNLIDAKRREFDPIRKGKKICGEEEVADLLLAMGRGSKIRDEQECREMWHVLTMDWWHVYDYETSRCPFSKSYYEMSPKERLHNPLLQTPLEFPRALYERLSRWLPQLLPEKRRVVLNNWRTDRDPSLLHAEWNKLCESGN